MRENGKAVIIIITSKLTFFSFSVYRSPICSDLGNVVLSPRSSDHAVRGLLLWVWLYCVDAPDIVCVYPSVQLWRADVAQSIQQVTSLCGIY